MPDNIEIPRRLLPQFKGSSVPTRYIKMTGKIKSFFEWAELSKQ